MYRMAYKPYVTSDYYTNEYGGSRIPENELREALKKASRHIDTLTYNRIIGRGFQCLTEFQQDVIYEVICQQAEFEYENADVIESILSSYSINGTSASFGKSWNVFAEHGIAMRKDVYAMLCQTGLCCRLVV